MTAGLTRPANSQMPAAFHDGELGGLKLIGVCVWERPSGTGRNVTFPAHQHTVKGDRRGLALLRPVADAAAQERVRARFPKTATVRRGKQIS